MTDPRHPATRTPRRLALAAAALIGLGAARPTAAQTPVGDWTAPVWPIEGHDLSEADVTLDTAGVAHAVFTAAGGPGDGAATVVGYAARDARGWSLPEHVPCGFGVLACSQPAVAVDALGIVHAVYVAVRADGAEILHRERAIGTARWSAAARVSAAANGIRRLDPAVAADHIAQLHVVWTDGAGAGDVLYRQRLPDGSWRDITPVHEPMAGAQSAAALTVASNDTVHAVWRDDRDGAPAVWTSQLPERSFVWWPDAPLSRAADGVAGAPAVAAAAGGSVHAAWVATAPDGIGRMMMARLTPAGPFWEPARGVFAATFGAVLDVALASSPGADLALVWTESRPADRSRLYAGRLNAALQLVDVRRVDGTVRAPHARAPRLAADDDGEVLAAWDEAGSGGRPSIALSTGRVGVPEREAGAFEGFLEPQSAVFGCQQDGYHLVACDGAVTIAVLSDHPALARLAGDYISVEGEVVDAPGCRRVTATAFAPRTPPCARSAASVLGTVQMDGRPLPGARVVVGGHVTQSGRSGRFALTGVAPASVTVTATAPCALSLSAGTVDLPPRRRLDLGTATFLAGDVVSDCVIDVRDLARAAWDVRQPADDTHACSDVNRDGNVNVADLDVIRQRMGLTCPQPWSPTPLPPPAAAPVERPDDR